MPEISLPLSRKIRYFLEFSFVKFFLSSLQILPLSLARALGRILGNLFYLLLPSRFQIAKKNLKDAFPQISEDEIKSIVKGCWSNLGMGTAEFAHLPTSSDKLYSLMDSQGLESIRESYKKGKGILIFTAHYGVWELGGKFWPESGFKTAVVARRIKNPYVNQLVTHVREGSGAKVILAREAVRESIRWLKEGGLLAVLIDHRVTAGGLAIPFFGKPAYTTSLPAILALRYNIPTHPAYCIREGDKFKVHISPAIDFSDLKPNEEGVQEATLRMTQVVENWIRQHPQNWLWIHDRWK